ncbi:MAG: FMN-binding protein [Clostridia bacterium]|nr:FMN-binding protein [Clostridia bacterium]
MKIFIKIVLSAIIAFILIIAGGVFYLTRGLDSGSRIDVRVVDMSAVEDGTYIGEYKAGRFTNKVNVTVKDHKITKIDIEKDVTFNKPEWTKLIMERVLEKQNTDIDVVSGATVTSKAYLKAIENALSK